MSGVCVGGDSYQFSGPHLEENLLSVLTVVATLHDGQQELGGVILQMKCVTYMQKIQTITNQSHTNV